MFPSYRAVVTLQSLRKPSGFPKSYALVKPKDVDHLAINWCIATIGWAATMRFGNGHVSHS